MHEILILTVAFCLGAMVSVELSSLFLRWTPQILISVPMVRVVLCSVYTALSWCAGLMVVALTAAILSGRLVV